LHGILFSGVCLVNNHSEKKNAIFPLPFGGGLAALSGILRMTVSYYHKGPAVRIDNDNMVKPIQDALIGLVYQDDRLITDTMIRKTNIDGPFYVRGSSLLLLEALSKGDEFLHIIIDEAPNHSNPLR